MLLMYYVMSQLGSIFERLRLQLGDSPCSCLFCLSFNNDLLSVASMLTQALPLPNYDSPELYDLVAHHIINSFVVERLGTVLPANLLQFLIMMIFSLN